MDIKLHGENYYEGSCGKSVVNQQPGDAFNPSPSVCHPACMADESGSRLGLLES